MTQKMYIGPSKPYKLALMKNAIILDVRGVAGLEDALSKHAELAQLLVPISELAEARQKVKEQGEPLQLAYKKVFNDTMALREGGE